MSAIRSKGRRGHTAVPNWRISDTSLDPYEFRIAAWLASHTDDYCVDWVTRNSIARETGISAGKVTLALTRLSQLDIIEVTTREPRSRLLVTFDHDAWETPPLVTTRPVTGHDVTGDWSPHDQSTDSHLSMGEDQEEEQTEGVVEPLFDAVFDAFYSAYPHKVGKPAARRAFKAAMHKVENLDPISDGLRRWVEHWKAAGTGTQFIPHPATWLNQERWNDECPAVVLMQPRDRARAALEAMVKHPSNGGQHELG